MSENNDPLNKSGDGSDEDVSNACVFKPEDIAEKLGVPATRIGVYARSFENLFTDHMELTEGKHRRFSSKAVNIMIQLHMLIQGTANKPGMSYKLANEEMTRRLKKDASISEELMPYETALQLKELSRVERELYSAIIHEQEKNNELRQMISSILQNQQLEREESAERERRQELALAHSAEKSQALHTIYLLKAKGKPTLLARLLGLRNIEKENEVIKHCEEIIQRESPTFLSGPKLITELKNEEK